MNKFGKLTLVSGALALGSMGFAANAHDTGVESSAEAAGNKIERAAERTGDFISDAALTTKVKAALATTDGLHDMEIKVDTDNGVVKLMGEVKTDAEITLAENVVKDLEGVVRVDNQLQVDKS